MEDPKVKIISKCLGHNVTSYSVPSLSQRTVSIFVCVCAWTDLCLDIMPNSVHSSGHTPSNNCIGTVRTALSFVF